MVQLSHPYLTIGKIIGLTIWTLVGRVMFVLFNMPSIYKNTFSNNYMIESNMHMNLAKDAIIL